MIIAVLTTTNYIILSLLSILFISLVIYFLKKKKNQSNILQNGIKGKAKIISIRDTGKFNQSRQVYKLNLLVDIPQESMYNAESEILLPSLYASKLNEGSYIEIMVDKNNKQNVLIITQADIPVIIES